MNWAERRRELDERLGTLPAISVLSTIELHRLHGEDLVETARRLMLREALERTKGRQDLAAEILGTYPVRLGRWLRHYRESLEPSQTREKRGAA